MDDKVLVFEDGIILYGLLVLQLKLLISMREFAVRNIDLGLF